MTKICIKTAGCSLNLADSEQMAGTLKKAGFEIVYTFKEADLIILNTCTVKTKTENKFFNYLEKVKRLNKPIIIAGCIPQTTPEKLAGFSLIGTRQIDNIVEVVEETLNNNAVVCLSYQDHPKLSLERIRKNPIVEIIPICRGCLGNCSYCLVRLARGKLRSYSIEEILQRVKLALSEGAKEIWLTAQDTGCYGFDINTDLPALLKEIIKIPVNFKLRVGMMNPNHVLQFIDELIEVYKNEKIFKFLHLPLQSGSPKILKAMNRKYSVEDFIILVEKFKKAIPEITLATDLICGFPGETDEQFHDSLDVIKKVQPAVINISRFWPRPKTKAAELPDQFPSRITKDRSRIATEIYHSIAQMQNERWLGWQGDVIIDEIGKDQTFIGRNYAYRPVILTTQHRLGEIVEVKIKKVTPFDLRA